MDKKSKILLGVFFLLILASIGATYYRIVVRRDYLIESQIDCDPTLEKCFVYHCDPAVESCTGNEVEDTSYYKIAKRKANKIPICDPVQDENCQPFVCGENEKDCGEILCDEKTKEKDNKDQCNDPAQYNLDNPPVAEEEIACDPATDESCQGAEGDGAVDTANDNSGSDQPETQVEPVDSSAVL
jgi:hypothetical protein